MYTVSMVGPGSTPRAEESSTLVGRLLATELAWEHTGQGIAVWDAADLQTHAAARWHAGARLLAGVNANLDTYLDAFQATYRALCGAPMCSAARDHGSHV